MTVFDKKVDQVQEIKPGTIVVAKANGDLQVERFADDPARETGCSFERIYFSRGNDPDIYAERKMLGSLLVPDVLKSVGSDFSNSVFSYVPNTAESAYYGFMDTCSCPRAEVHQQLIEAKNKGELTDDLINELVMDNWPKEKR